MQKMTKLCIALITLSGTPALALAQQTTATDPTVQQAAEAADREDKGEWGWIGLLGLAGLLGLIPRKRDRDTVRTRT